jgi:hypothetical protein
MPTPNRQNLDWDSGVLPRTCSRQLAFHAALHRLPLPAPSLSFVATLSYSVVRVQSDLLERARKPLSPRELRGARALRKDANGTPSLRGMGRLSHGTMPRRRDLRNAAKPPHKTRDTRRTVHAPIPSWRNDVVCKRQTARQASGRTMARGPRSRSGRRCYKGPGAEESMRASA